MASLFPHFVLVLSLQSLSNSLMTHKVTEPAMPSQEKKKEYNRSSFQRITASTASEIGKTNIFRPGRHQEPTDESTLYFLGAPWYKQDMQRIGSRVSYTSAARSVGPQAPSKAPAFRSFKEYLPETSLWPNFKFKEAPKQHPKGLSLVTNPQNPGISTNLVLVVLKLSIKLRDNMVKVFAYILRSSHFRLSLDLHETLREIYRLTRNRLINICDMMFSINDLQFLDPQEQFVYIFEWLEHHGPRYIVGEVKLWLDALKTKEVRIASSIRSENDLFTIDFLENMREDILRIKEHKIVSNQATTFASQRTTSMGNFLGSIVELIREGYLEVTLPVIGSMLMHLHLDNDSPEVEEAVRYLADVSYQNKPEMHFAVENISVHDMKDPYILVIAVLTKIEDKYESYSLVSESVAMILPYLRPPNIFVSNRNHQTMLEILKSGEINFSLLFGDISPNEYPEDVVESKQLLLRAITNDEVNMKPFFKDFVPHEYTTSRDLLVAVVDRIKRRVKLSQNLKDHIDALSSHLKVKYDAIKMQSRNSQGLFYLIQLFDAFKSPSLPLYLRRGANDVLQAIKNIPINWDDELERFSPDGQSRPRAIAVKLLKSFLHSEFCKGRHVDLKLKISGFLGSLDSDGEPRKCQPKGCRLPNVITEVRSYVRSRDGKMVIGDEKSIHQINITDLISYSDARSGDDIHYSIFREFLFSPEFSKIIEPFDPSLFFMTTDLLKNLTRRSLMSPLVQNDPMLNNSTSAYLRNLEENIYGSKPISWLRPETKTIDMGGIFKVVEKKILHQGQHVKNLHRVAEFLARDITPRELLYFDFQCLYSKKDFLRGLLNHLLTLPILSEYIKNDIKIVEEYIVDDDNSGEPLEFSKFC